MTAVSVELALELLGRGEQVCFTARGASMRPFVRDGDVVTVRPGAAGVAVGALVLASDGEFGVVHRVVRRRGARVLVKVGAMPRSDGWFDDADLLGRVVGVERDGRPVRPRRWLPLAVSAMGGLLRRLRPRRSGSRAPTGRPGQ